MASLLGALVQPAHKMPATADCTFGNCPKDASVYHQDCLEAYLKSIRLERNRKTGYRCPRGSGKHSRFPDQCPGKISKSHPIHTRNECTKKKSKTKQPEPPQPVKQKGTKAAEAKAPAKGGAGAAAAGKATAGAAKHAAAPAAVAAAPSKVQRTVSVVSKEQQLKDAKAAFRQELGLKASPLSSRASSLRPAQGPGVCRTVSAGGHGSAWSQGGSRSLAASGPSRSTGASDGSSSSTSQGRGKAQQQRQRSASPPPINSEAVFPTVAAAVMGHEAKQPVSAQAPHPQGTAAAGQRMQTSWVKVAGAEQALSPRGPGDESIKAFQPTAAAQGAPPPPGTPSPAQLQALQPRSQAGVLAVQSPQSRRSIGRTVPLEVVHPRSGLSSESPSPRTSESGRLSRSQRKSLRRAERKPGPGNGGCSDTVPRSMEAMRLSPVDEPAGDPAEEGGDVEAAGHFEAVAEVEVAAAALGPEPSGMFGDLEGWAGDNELGDVNLPEHDSSEEGHSHDGGGSLAYQQCVQALTFRKAQLQVHQLQQLGFQEYQAIAAVQRWGDDVQSAVTWLLEGSVRSEQEAQEIMETQSEPFLDISEELAHVREAQTWVKGPSEHLWAAISACKGDLDTAVALLLQQQREQEELALPASYRADKVGLGLSPHLASPTDGQSLSLFHNEVLHSHNELLPGEQAAQGRGATVSPFAGGLGARPLSLKLTSAEHMGGLSVTPPDRQVQGRMSARTSLDGFGAPPRLQGYQTSGDYSGLGMDSVHSSQNLGLFEGSPSWGAVDSPATPATGYSLFAAGTGGGGPASNGYTLGADPASMPVYGGGVAPGPPSLHSPGMRPASAAYASSMGSPGGRMLMQPQAATPTGVHYSPGAAGQHFLQVLGSPCDSGPAPGVGWPGSIQAGQQRLPVFQRGFSVHPQRSQNYVGQHYGAPKRDVPEAALLAAASVDLEEPSTAPAAHSAGDAQELNVLMASLTCR
eukprot:jgi/Astpho2/9784/fgenesh1_pg.00149_%23_56_t